MVTTSRSRPPSPNPPAPDPSHGVRWDSKIDGPPPDLAKRVGWGSVVQSRPRRRTIGFGGIGAPHPKLRIGGGITPRSGEGGWVCVHNPGPPAPGSRPRPRPPGRPDHD